MLERWSNFRIQIFIYSNKEDAGRIFLFCFNKICNAVALICVSTEKNLYLNLLVTNQIFLPVVNLSFTGSLNVSLIEMDG